MLIAQANSRYDNDNESEASKNIDVSFYKLEYTNALKYRDIVHEVKKSDNLVMTLQAPVEVIDVKPEEAPSIENLLFIGDSNTVRMTMYNENMNDALHVSAICGVSTGGWDSYTNGSNTTNNRTIKTDLDNLSSNAFSHVVIMLGTNDFGKSRDKFIGDYVEILDYINNRNSNAVVNMVTVPPVRDSKSPSIKNNQADNLAEFIKELSKAYTKLEINLIDLNSSLSENDMSAASSDGYHFSKDGAVKAFEFIKNNCK